MMILLSPSKTLGDGSCHLKATPTQPALLDQSELLISVARKLSVSQLQALMDISEKLARLNHDRFKHFQTPFTASNATPAIFTFQGDVYDGFDAASLTARQLKRAQAHLRILSGLYGLLRPLDLMQPYRLEMGVGLKNPRGKHLYGFWDDRITQTLNDEAAKSKSKAIINLASEEYFKAIQPKACALPIITPVFKESKNGQLKTIGLMAKKARGRMARWIIDESLHKPEDLTAYTQDGYRFVPRLSTGSLLVFTR